MSCIICDLPLLNKRKDAKYCGRRCRNIANYEAVRKIGRTKARRIRAFLSEVKLTAGCMDCGYNKDSVALDFDHRPDEIKSFGLAAIKPYRSYFILIQEIMKCDVVCANCHRIRTKNRNSNKGGS